MTDWKPRKERMKIKKPQQWLGSLHLPKRLRLALHCQPWMRRPKARKAVVSRVLITGIEPTSAESPHVAQQACLLGNKRLLRHLLLQAASQGSQLLQWQDSAGRSLLATACSAGHEDVVRLLLQYGADPYLNDYHGVSPLMHAAAAGQGGVVRLLLEQAEADAFHMSDSEHTALVAAAAAGSAPCIQTLLQVAQVEVRQAGERNGDHALLAAAAGCHMAALRSLLAHPSARVNQTDKEGNTALLLAARHGDLAMVKYLLQHGAKPCIQHFASRRMPLHEAACEGHLEVVQALLPHIPINQLQAMDSDGRTALQLAGHPLVRHSIEEFINASKQKELQQ